VSDALVARVAAKLDAFALDADLALPGAGVTAIAGPSGSGKTTLLRCIAGLEPRARGRIQLGAETWLDSERGVFVPPHRRGAPVVFQDAAPFSHLSVRGNLAYGLSRCPPERRHVGFDEATQWLRIEALLERRTEALSGGERQRVAIARALLAGPRLLLLDEPLAAIDVARREEVLPYLESLRDRYSIPMLYVSHQYDEVLRLATHVVLLAGGRVVASGSPAALGVDPRLAALIGADAVGAVLEVEVVGRDAASGLASVALGAELLRFALPEARTGARVRLHVLARDVILATEAPRGLSVRNALRGTLAALVDEGPDAVLAAIEVGGTRLLARVTRAAVAELALGPGQPVWALVKAASLRGHVYARPAA